ncbi:MAG: ATP-binding cassette domain-containing protein, partial [Chloroflexi bacterium]|nr:ATP-binding cassette domain-containing protein [Chloroflexota bacterium]
MSEPIIALEHASQVFTTRRGDVRAVDDLVLALNEREIVCLAGESGCGKTTTGKMVAGLLAPTSGALYFRGQNVLSGNRQAQTAFRRGVQIVHQDPYASLNPIHTVYQTLSAPLFVHGL